MARRTLPQQLWADFIYLSAGLPMGTLWLAILATGLSVSIGTAIVIVGFVGLALMLLIWRFGADLERERASLVLGAPIRRAHRPLPPTGFFQRWRVRVTDPATWKDLAFLLILGPLGIATAIVYGAIWSAAIAGIAAPALSSTAPDDSVLGGWGPLTFVCIVVGGFACIAVALAVGRGMAIMWGALANALLAPGDRAALEARARELEVTRAAAVDSADARLRRIERDLHDGAQHRLAYVAMELGRAREKLADDPEGADRLLAEAHEESKRAMGELRDLARGIHPSVLTDRGLDAAVSALAERCPVPVDVELRLDRRPPPAVETAAYYVIAEALTNVGKHAGARSARVRASDDDGQLVVEIADDGRGGARRAPGSGLEGLAQRVEALDGTLAVQSPEGAGTTVRAEFPCAS
ncbi:MAG: sensor histidine kinase [Solirubrobacteraceae bacterium]